MINPISTYRFQFNRDFTFKDFEPLIPYLQQLGVGSIYASPIFDTVPGSTHGYDGLSPHRINPEIGTIAQLRAISQQLKANGINWLQDIVPNHMAFHPKNQWLMDVLEKGPQSQYVSFFDITWTDTSFHGRLMVPFLGTSLEEVIKRGELKIVFEQQRFVFAYYDANYPLQPLSYAVILKSSQNKMPDSIAQLISLIPKMEDEKAYAESWDEIRSQLAGLMKNSAVKSFVDDCLQKINADPVMLEKIAAAQSYRLCHWQETDRRINYRRFFTVNGLICLNIQNENVFDQYHQLVHELIEQGIFQGLRIDHIDGLFDPSQYLNRLRQKTNDSYVVVEKILEPGEDLPGNWPVEGNTGYDFLSLVNNLFTNQSSEKIFARFYKQLVKNNRSIHEQIHDKKSYILNNHMNGELENLYHLFMNLDLVEKKTFATIRPEELKEAIGEFLVQCPVYRYYGTTFPLPEKEAQAVQDILNKARLSNHELRRAINILEDVLLRKPDGNSQEVNQRVAHFYQRCMQFTGPLMAKGVEDTLMYTYNRFIGHNDVGDSPEAFGINPGSFHEAMLARQKQWPLSLNATSTHDTKRGEDVRARLNVITDLGDAWTEAVKEWIDLNAHFKQNDAPDANDEYFIYQTLIGTWPMSEEENFSERITEYLKKSLREAKTHSGWTSPNEAYEKATTDFAVALLDRNNPFYKSFENFYHKIVDHGIVNSLSQLLLKFSCPGVADIYQGCELWDLTLVDPDNRRAVDYNKRQEWLEEISAQPNNTALWNERKNGKIKLWLTNVLLKLRRQQPELFTVGEYIPLQVEGACKEHVFAFARKQGRSIVIIAIPLHTAVLCKDQGTELSEIDWNDTRIVLPEGVSSEWQYVLNDTRADHQHDVPVAELFKELPFAILKGGQAMNERGAGILLHISSLPSAFGIGDMGPEAIGFADFLHRSRQKYWQLLPLNPTEEGQGHSPYSSISSRAGNVLLISPELLVSDGLLDLSEVQKTVLVQQGKTDYAEAADVKEALFEKAWQAFSQHGKEELKTGFEEFMLSEKEWLDDFALYALLKQINKGAPWYAWKNEWKNRSKRAIEELSTGNNDALQKIKWLQYIFARQWHQLKSYCNRLGIQLIGDLPFYVSHDSADVWTNSEIFALDEDGNVTGMAGVPPDAFSADGQLWGMPVFKWEVLKENNYTWWVDRLRKNRELFDMVRLDHFRAFSAFWQVPAGEKTARNGEWVSGPGADFFHAVREQLGELPFVAEDLGEIDEPVYRLRDEFRLPGMKVLQFAFGSDMPRSIHIPHNYKENFIVYTGTHDNNTIRGWYTTEANEENHLALEKYVGRPLSSAEIPIVLSRMAYASVARIVILPLQDVLGLDEGTRMNTPASGENNWTWRLLPGQITGVAEENLKKWTRMYNRE